MDVDRNPENPPNKTEAPKANGSVSKSGGGGGIGIGTASGTSSDISSTASSSKNNSEMGTPTSDANLLVATKGQLNTNQVNCSSDGKSTSKSGGGGGSSKDGGTCPAKVKAFKSVSVFDQEVLSYPHDPSAQTKNRLDLDGQLLEHNTGTGGGSNVINEQKMAQLGLIDSSTTCRGVEGAAVGVSVLDDMDDVDTNLDLVEEHLYLGNLAAACDILLLKKYRITHILTIDSCPLPTKIQDLSFVNSKFLKVSDMPREDILRYFEETNYFISTAVSGVPPGNILVHCYYGVSRSATIVLAYLMQKYRISLEEAQDRLKSRRSVVGPNYGFLSQLKLYEKMGYRIDRTNIFYKRFRLHVASDKLKSVKVLATPYTDVIKADPSLFTVKPEPVVYRCRKCRRILACESNVLPHTESKSPLWFDFHKSKEEEEPSAEAEGSASCAKNTKNLIPPPICTQMLFVEPLAWMADVILNIQGKLHCPNTNCKSKLGSFSWVMGCLCPCGAKVQPAFYLVPSKVDRSTSVLNVQITL